MRPLHSVQRRTGFETLEAKKLFAADLVGGAAIDFSDTAVVEGFEHGDVRFPYILGYQEGGENSIVGDSLMIGDHNLDGQEGEPVIDLVSDLGFENLGGQEGGPVIDPIDGSYLGGQEGESVVTAITPNGAISQVHHIKPYGSAGSWSDYPEVTEQHELGGQEGEPLMNTNLPDTLIVDGEGLYQRNELELATNLGGQEGDPSGFSNREVYLDVNWDSAEVQEGEPVMGLWQDCNDYDGADLVFENLGGQEGEPVTGNIAADWTYDSDALYVLE